MRQMPHLGAHESVSGGLHLAFERIHSVGGKALQIFTRNQRQWNPKELASEEIDAFSAEWRNCPEMEVASHGSYLVNLATDKEDLLEKSINAFVLELERCQQLGIEKVVLHPGSHGGAGVAEGIKRFTRGLDKAIERARSETLVLVETTAGQGTGLGATFAELGAILEQSRYPERLRVCVDTCHIFAAGYDITSPAAYEQTMAEFDKAVGIQKIAFFHLNDSKKDLGSRVDRHTHIGEGCIGLEGFRNLLNDPRFADSSMALETPKNEDLEDDRINLRRLTDLVNENTLLR
jgi:deoxyribonuclease IV